MHMFGHIAHNGPDGFFAIWFADLSKQVAWLNYVAEGGVYGRPMGFACNTWSDVEQAFTTWIKTSGLLEQYRARQVQAIETHERALLAQLKAKYE